MTSPFYAGTSLQFAWNSSSLGTLKDCARKYYLQYILGWGSKGTGLHLRFGSLYHSALELYDRRVISGESLEDALDHTVHYLLESTWDRTDDDPEGTPWDTQDTKKNRETLVRSVVWYIDNYSPDPAKTFILQTGEPALELSFKMEFPLNTPQGEPYLLTGHMDRMVKYGEDLFISDRKTTGSTLSPHYFEQYSPDNQMSLYTYAGRQIYSVPVSGVLIDAAQIAVGFTAFSRGITTRSEGQLKEWEADTAYWLKQAEAYAEVQHWPMNDKSCHDYGGCPFRSICNKDPSVREHFLKTHFTQSGESAGRILD